MYATPNRRLGFSSLPPNPAPFLTPRPEKRSFDLRWADGSSTASRNDRDREVNIQVMLRCRPLTDEEQRLNVQKVVSCNEQKNEVTVLQSLVNKQLDKTFTFDKVFGPKIQQRSVYDHAIAPIVNDVLEGFNCTVFAYGQTGTGKTYTMEGGMKHKGGDLSADAGVIPRAVRHIFDTLEAQKADYNMKVTFLELYNEEITDLLAPEDHTRFTEDRQRRPISLMEDGKGGAVIRGLEEVVVYSANEIYKLLEHGSARRRTADTLLNKQSSRSHSVFSITIHVKEAARGNEELIKCGRLNLVDLAGSENISRSGSREARGREAGEVNKSLLTLGRVITALVEHSGHIPYRDSKLTRLLRESLGGKAKTCFIATVSPSIHCLDETLSTLDYAYRAKSIKNKPEANQKFSKSVLLKDLYLEIERMKQDVRAAREKNGVYIPHERFVQDEAEKKAMSEKIEHLKSDLERKTKQADRFQDLYHAEEEKNLDLESEISECKANFESNKNAFLDLQETYARTNTMLKEKEFIISKLLHSESAILEHAKQLRSSLENASEDMSMLLAKLERQSKIETENQGLILTFGSQLDQNLKSLHEIVIGSVCQQHQLLKSMEEHVNSFIATKCEATKCLELKIEKIKDSYTSGILCMKELATALQKKAFSDIEEMKLSISAQMMAVENFLVTAASEAEQVLTDTQRSLAEQKKLLAFSAQQQEAGLQRSLVSTQAISKTTINFFNDLRIRATRLTTLLEENRLEKSHQLAAFEEAFKELSAKEEKVALEKIAEILTTLTTMKAKMVSEVIGNMNHTCIEANKRLQLEMSGMHQVSDNAVKEWIAYTEKVENQFQEDTCSTAKIKATTEETLWHCLEKMGQSMHHWKNVQLSVNHLDNDYAAEIEISAEKRNQENNSILEEVVSACSQAGVQFVEGTCDLLATAKNSLMVDHESRKEMELMSTVCSDHLKTMQDNHTRRISGIRSLAKKCLLHDYLVDHPTSKTPLRQSINVPSLASIEELRTSLCDLVSEFKPENILKRDSEGKQQLYLSKQTSRSPLTPLN
ncbi:kinesin-like protein KIN-5B [Elaeis guineensis]|uniref:kinesin-like protein KIN-5B n=1 Tax=Elaeis guineensis var. tenera TaxID=51953 RepID=UPI003C6D2A0F